MIYTKREMRIANGTSRSDGAVGANAVVPLYVMDYANKDDLILDYGAGIDAIHKDELESKGYQNVTAYEFGDNLIQGVHDPLALRYKYDVVYASNVLNVQCSRRMLARTLEQLIDAVAPEVGALLIANFPKEPRKNSMNGEEVLSLAAKLGGDEFEVDILEGGESAPVFRMEYVGD